MSCVRAIRQALNVRRVGVAVVLSVLACRSTQAQSRAPMPFNFPEDAGNFRITDGNRIEIVFPLSSTNLKVCSYGQFGRTSLTRHRYLAYYISHRYPTSYLSFGAHEVDAVIEVQLDSVTAMIDSTLSGDRRTELLRDSTLAPFDSRIVLTDDYVRRTLAGAKLRLIDRRGEPPMEFGNFIVQSADIRLSQGRLAITFEDTLAIQKLMKPGNVSVTMSWCGNGYDASHSQVTIDRNVRTATATARVTPASAPSLIQLGSDTFTVPRVERIDWSHAAVGKTPRYFERFPLVTTSDTAEDVIVFIVRPDSSGRVNIEPHYSRLGLNEGWLNRRVENLAPVVGVPRCSKEPWVAAFFIEGIGATPKGDATVQFLEANEIRYSLRVDPKRNMLRAQPAIEFYTRDVRDLSADTSRGVSPRLKRAPDEPPSIHLLLNESAHGWTGSGASTGIGFHTYFSPFDTAPRDVWRDYVLDDPGTCVTKLDK